MRKTCKFTLEIKKQKTKRFCLGRIVFNLIIRLL